MADLVASCEKQLSGLAGKVVLDVGCNDGSLLDYFRDKGSKTIGVEPTGAYTDALNKGHALYNCFFSEQSAKVILKEHGHPDVITFTNVFAHIEDLPQVIAALKLLMSPRTMLVIENHYLGAVLDRHQFDTFYHEHPRTYSLSSFLQIARSLGAHLSGAEFPARYGGNIRVFMGGPIASDDSAKAVKSVLANESHYLERFARLQSNVTKWKITTGDRIAELVKKHGKLSAKAFPGRAAILIKLLGIDNDSITEVFEKPGSMKIGYYMPGTRVPIKSDLELFSRAGKPPVLINLAWHLSGEIRAYLKQNCYEGLVIDILDPRDFAAEE
jgi:D-mycarose 3-C-methyltransferase